jgi:type III restriction enzyme
MKLRFKQQQYQIDAVEAVADCFEGQPLSDTRRYRLDPGLLAKGQQTPMEFDEGFRNQDILLSAEALLKNVQAVQRRQNLQISPALEHTPASRINLDVEMETGTGKTYCYIRTAFEMNRRYGWSKFIIVVPSVAIREGVAQSLKDTTEHFQELYGKKARHFIYNSRQLHELESFSSDAGVNIMIINVQAFNARGKDARRIYEELDDFQSRRPIDVLKRNRPIMIMDEPQKMEGAKTVEGLKEFDPLFVLRYSATHRKEHNKVYRLDALDAYNQKLVKKIAVRGVKARGLAGTNAYLYLERIDISPSRPPVARVEMEVRGKQAIRKEWRTLGKGDNLFDKSKGYAGAAGLDQYDGYIVSEIDARDNTLHFTNGQVLTAGDATGDVTEAALRRIQIREAIQAHFEKERELFPHGIKVLTLFFIDEVAKYRLYDEAGEQPGEYARFFEEEYTRQLNQVQSLHSGTYGDYLKKIEPARTHDGYFAQDKKGRMVNPGTAARSDESDDQTAYDLILRNKARLLSFEEPVRFLFSHSALREGWDNPNVFVIGMLKHSVNNISRRQEVGRGLRLAVNQNGDRMDHPATVHQINVLTVIASEGYKEFVAGLQRDMLEALSARPRKADTAFFTGKVLHTDSGDIEVTEKMGQMLSAWLLVNGYTDDKHVITPDYHEAKAAGMLASLPASLAPHAAELFKLVDSVFNPADLPAAEDDRNIRSNKLNTANFEKKEFRELWNRIHRKAVYSVSFNTDELIEKSVAVLDAELKVAPLQYVVERGEQTANTTYEALRGGDGFATPQTQTSVLQTSVQSQVPYDLIGKLAEETQLTRRTIGAILHRMAPSKFALFRANPEDFLRVAGRLINEQKASVIIEHLTYNPTSQSYSIDIFSQDKPKADFSKAVEAERHIYEYVFVDANTEREFVKRLDKGVEVDVYAKLPKSFFIPTPVGNYSPDWAIAFKEGTVKHIYFIAETKGDLSSLELRGIEEAKIKCARKFFANITSDQVRYEVVDSYQKLMELVH